MDRIQTSGLGNEFERLAVGKEATVEALTKEAANGFPALFAVIESPVIDIHADEFVSQIASHVAGILESVLDGFGAVVETELDAGGKDVGDGFANVRWEALMDDVAAKWEGQAIVFGGPPGPEIGADLEAFVLISELAFVDDQPDIGAA